VYAPPPTVCYIVLLLQVQSNSARFVSQPSGMCARCVEMRDCVESTRMMWPMASGWVDTCNLQREIISRCVGLFRWPTSGMGGGPMA